MGSIIKVYSLFSQMIKALIQGDIVTQTDATEDEWYRPTSFSKSHIDYL
jgi:hypothetical protein